MKSERWRSSSLGLPEVVEAAIRALDEVSEDQDLWDAVESAARESVGDDRAHQELCDALWRFMATASKVAAEVDSLGA